MRRLPLAALALLAVAAATWLPQPVADAQSKTLVVTGYGGRWSEVMKKALVEPFEKKYDARVEIVTGITTQWVAKLMAVTDSPRPAHFQIGRRHRRTPVTNQPRQPPSASKTKTQSLPRPVHPDLTGKW